MKVAIILACIVAFAAAGNSDSWRIVGGSTAAEGQFPYQISLRRYGSHSCGGSILDETTILCAAHCVVGAPVSSLSVSLGNNKLNGQTQTHEVKSYVSHENYDSMKIQNDISIIKLATPIQFNEHIKPVALRQSNIIDEDVVLSGWGRNGYPIGSIPNKLQFIRLKTITVDECRAKQGRNVIDSEVCTFTKRGEGACHGDSGGPLVDSNGEQIGIVSWGSPCAVGRPDVFTRVYSFLDWIEKNRG